MTNQSNGTVALYTGPGIKVAPPHPHPGHLVNFHSPNLEDGSRLSRTFVPVVQDEDGARQYGWEASRRVWIV
jgi:hypothetical protein